MSQTTVSSDLLQSLQIVTHLGVGGVGKDLVSLSINDISLSVQEPIRDLVLLWVLHDCDDSLKFLNSEFTGSLVEIDIGLLAHEVGVSTTDTLDLSQGEHDLVLAVDIGVEQTENVLDYDKVRIMLRAEVSTYRYSFLGLPERTT